MQKQQCCYCYISKNKNKSFYKICSISSVGLELRTYIDTVSSKRRAYTKKCGGHQFDPGIEQFFF